MPTTRAGTERRIVRCLAADLLTAGYTVSVSLDGGYDIDDMLTGSRDVHAIVRAAFEGDVAHLFAHAADRAPIIDGAVEYVGWVLLVFGNDDGTTVISDYTTSLDAQMAGANDLARRIEASA